MTELPLIESRLNRASGAVRCRRVTRAIGHHAERAIAGRGWLPALDAESRSACLLDGRAGGFALDGRLHVEEHVFDVARFVETHQAVGESFDLVF